jgi:hypothetical protein
MALESQLQLALEAMSAALRDASLNWSDLTGLVAASSRFKGGIGWGLYSNEFVQAVAEQGIPCVNVGGAWNVGDSGTGCDWWCRRL